MLNWRNAAPRRKLPGHERPTLLSFERLDADAQKAFAADLMALAGRFNRSGDGTFVAPGEYLEVILTV